MQVIYKYLARTSKVNTSGSVILRFSLNGGDKIADEVMDSFEEHLIVSLKKNDVISRYAGCFFVLLNDLSGEEAKGVASRLSEEWKKPEGAEQIEAAYELAEIDG